MLTHTQYSDGQNRFKNNIFFSQEWSAPTMVSPTEIRERLCGFRLEGRKIRRIKMIGLSYFLTRDWVTSHAYDQLEQYEENERQLKSEYKNIDPQMPFARTSQIDEPLIIEFEDGATFEIDTPQEPEFCMSMNCIPWYIDYGTNRPNVDADILFAPCIGQTIKKVEVNTYMADKDPMLFQVLPSLTELVSDITLRFENGIGLKIGPSIDYCSIACIGVDGQYMTIPFHELDSALYNWEDIHTDKIIGFEAESGTLFFGEKGLRCVKKDALTIYADGRGDKLYINSEHDFLAFDWAALTMGQGVFDDLGGCVFSRDQWDKFLDQAERLLSFDSFDDLFDYMVAFDHMYQRAEDGDEYSALQHLNREGAEFWKRRDEFKKQWKDICAWTDQVLHSYNTLHIEGSFYDY